MCLRKGSEKRKVSLSCRNGVITCSCSGGKIDLILGSDVKWDGDCQACSRLRKCVDAIKAMRTSIFSQTQK